MSSSHFASSYVFTIKFVMADSICHLTLHYMFMAFPSVHIAKFQFHIERNVRQAVALENNHANRPILDKRYWPIEGV